MAQHSEVLAAATATNGAFSRRLPGLQTTVDSTSLGTFKECPRKYYYAIIQGWEPRLRSVHLTFGIWLHEAREEYEQARARGIGHEAALSAVVQSAMVKTWDKALGRGWWSDHKLKNRMTLLRSIVWYLDEHGQHDQLETVILANGRPAVELTFQFDSGLRSASTGEAIAFAGHLDRIARLGSEVYIADIKTTGQSIGPGFLKDFTPGNQFSMYALAGRVAFAQPIAGIIVDGLQVAVGFTRSMRGLVSRTATQLDEWLAAAGWWLRSMEDCAQEGQTAGEAAWPQNDKSCHNYSGCQFREVCGASPSLRPRLLEAGFAKRVWDPTKARGEV